MILDRTVPQSDSVHLFIFSVFLQKKINVDTKKKSKFNEKGDSGAQCHEKKP